MDLLNIQPHVVSTGLSGKHFCFYGPPSTRKTSVAALFPNALLIATEIGYSLIPGVRPVNVSSWAEFKSINRELARPQVQEMYKTIIVDTTGLLVGMCEQYICMLNGVSSLTDVPWGGGWKQFKSELRKEFNTIAQLGYGIVFIAHADIKYEENGDIKSALPQIDKQGREVVNALVDFTLFLRKEIKDGSDTETTVYAYSKLPGSIETKTRARYMSKRFEFNFEQLSEEVKKAVLLHQEEGFNVEENGQNLYKPSTHNFEDLKKDVIDLASRLLEDINMKENAITLISAAMKGIRLTEATVAHYETLEALLASLLELAGLGNH